MLRPSAKTPGNMIFSFIAVISILFSVFGIAYAALRVDTVEMPSYYAVNDSTAPRIASDYTKTAAGDTYVDRQWAIDDTNLDVVWKTYGDRLNASADPVFVVVMESCIDLQHEDLAGSFYRIGTEPGTGEAYIGAYISSDVTIKPMKAADWKAVNRYANSTDASYNDYFHGSHVAGIVGARHNAIGIAGASPSVYIIPVFIGGIYGEEEAFDWVIDELYGTLRTLTGKTPRIIIQNAWELTTDLGIDNSIVTDAFNRYKRASDAGILMVNGAGNSAKNLYDGTWEKDGKTYTAIPSCGGISTDNFLSVAGHDSNRNLNFSSNYSTAGADAQVHLSAPAAKIVSLGRNGEYWVASGTSMAAPHVSGTAALLWQLFPDATASEIKELILEGAKVTNACPVAPHHNESATTIGGYVRTGFLDAAESVKKSKEVLGEARGLDINIPVKRLYIAPTAYGIVEGGTAEMNITTILPYTADNKNVTFTSSDPNVARVVTSDGVHTITTGSVTQDTAVDIYATAADGTHTKSNTVTITVTNAHVPATSVAIKYNGEELGNNETINVMTGEAVTLEPVVYPADASVTDADFVWNISPAVPSTQNGRNITINPTAVGTYTVTVITGTLTARCELKVNGYEPAGISVTDAAGTPSGQLSVSTGSAVQLAASVTPENATYSPSDITWRVTAGNATLSSATGQTVTVTCRSEGMVTVQAFIGSHSASYNIQVTGGSTPPEPPSDGGNGGGGGGGCNSGFGSGLALLATGILPILTKKKK